MTEVADGSGPGSDAGDEEGAPGAGGPATQSVPRYRCTVCGNLTRFDVLERRLTRSYYHFTIGGSLRVEETEDLEREVERISCRWCGDSGRVEQLRAD